MRTPSPQSPIKPRLAAPHPDVARDQRLKKTAFLVEANAHERSVLWRDHNATAGLTWEQDLHALMIQVGEFGGMPVNIAASFATLNGQTVLFWYAASMVSHFKLIEDWFAKNVSTTAGTMPSSVTADRFHDVLHAVLAAPKAAA